MLIISGHSVIVSSHAVGHLACSQKLNIAADISTPVGQNGKMFQAQSFD